MKCDQIKENFYVYDQLSIEDKESVDHHLTHCDQCTLLFEQLEEQQAMITRASSWKEESTDPIALTQGIMNSIEQPSHVSLMDMIFNQFHSALVRYAMVSISLVLISFFVSEFNQNGTKGLMPQNASVPIVGSGTILNSSKIMKALRQKKAQPSVLSLYDCLKQCGFSGHEKPCEGCKDRFNKLIKNHEDS